MKKMVNTVGVEVPVDFPTDAYNAIHEMSSPKREPYPDEWREMSGGWNAVAYRFRSMAESDESFTDSVRRTGTGPEPEERYLQEIEIFSFFVSGISVIESFCYGLYGYCSLIENTNFPFSTFTDKKRVTPDYVTKKLTQHVPGEPISTELAKLVDSDEIRQWVGFRNYLVHRASPPRHHHLHAGAPAADDKALWKVDIKTGSVIWDVDGWTTQTRRKWMAQKINELMNHALAFVSSTSARLPSQFHK